MDTRNANGSKAIDMVKAESNNNTTATKDRKEQKGRSKRRGTSNSGVVINRRDICNSANG